MWGTSSANDEPLKAVTAALTDRRSVLGRLRATKLRTRIAVLAAASVSVAVVAASAGAFVLTRNVLRQQVDESLRGRASTVHQVSPEEFRVHSGDAPGGFRHFAQLLTPDGTVLFRSDDSPDLPVSPADGAVARGEREALLRDVIVDGVHLRMLTTSVDTRASSALSDDPDVAGRSGGAVQLARPLTEVDEALNSLRSVLALVALGGIALAAGLGMLVARNALRPVARLTGAAEHVARTRDLRHAIDVDRPDELGRLAASFNAMLAALETSSAQQQQLVTDASHELRTPLTSLRTNVDVLLRADDLAPDEHSRLLADVRSELEELTHLVAELVDLATDPDSSDEEPQDVHLDELAEHVASRARRRTGRLIDVAAEPAVVRGRPSSIERALVNLLDNACKWGDEGEPVEVIVGRRDGAVRVEVRDRGPGIDPVERPHVFDRFYRAPAARALPGSGLGLAIVKQAVEAHGGRVWADDAPGGGAAVGFELPARHADEVHGPERPTEDV